MDRTALKRLLTLHEGRRDRPYKDSEGNLTIGIGHNLDAKPLSDRVIDLIFEDDIADAIADLNRVLPWWVTLSDNRQIVIVDMCFNLGIGRLLKFSKTIAALQAKDWETAADEMLDSKWARQVGIRATRLADMMRAG